MLPMNRDLSHLLDLLDADESTTVGTSVRLPANLREAAVVAAKLGLAGSTTDLTVNGLREALETFAQRAVLDEHYRQHPEARPDLADVALAAADLDGSPLAGRRDLIERAVVDVAALKDDPSPDDVLLYAAGLAAATAAA